MRPALLLLALLFTTPTVFAHDFPDGFAEGSLELVAATRLADHVAKDFTTTKEAYEGIGNLARALRRHGNRRALFAGIYALTIEATHKRLAAGGFRNPAWVRSLIVNYANIYRRTIRLELTGQRSKLPVAWQHAFGYIARTVPYAEEGKETWSADLDAVYGIHVHIARDLVEALFATPTNFRSPSQEADYLAITESLRGTMPAIYSWFSSFRGGFSPLAPIERSVMMNWIASLRREAWANAAAYAHLGPQGRAQLLRSIDARTERRSRRHGGLLPLLPR